NKGGKLDDRLKLSNDRRMKERPTVDFAYSGEQQALRGAARDFLADRVPLPVVAGLADAEPGWDPSVWDSRVRLGRLDAALGLLDHAVLLEEAGYALLPAPYFSTVALAWPAGDGRSRLTLAWAEAGRPAGLFQAEASTTVSPDGAVTGEKVLV